MVAVMGLYLTSLALPKSYANTFLDNSTTMVWFAQPTQKVSTPVIQRLLQNGLSAARAAQLPVTGWPSDDPALQVPPPPPGAEAVEILPATIVLFCRLPDQPYVCFGRLALRLFDGSQQPLKFVWYLCDVARLRDSLSNWSDFVGSGDDGVADNQ